MVLHYYYTKARIGSIDLLDGNPCADRSPGNCAPPHSCPWRWSTFWPLCISHSCPPVCLPVYLCSTFIMSRAHRLPSGTDRRANVGAPAVTGARTDTHTRARPPPIPPPPTGRVCVQVCECAATTRSVLMAGPACARVHVCCVCLFVCVNSVEQFSLHCHTFLSIVIRAIARILSCMF